jgi:glycosyltransferase involved in cell wall biosynthesis
LRVLALGRTSTGKGYPLIIEAVSNARRQGADIELTIAGPSVTDGEIEHRRVLEDLVRRSPEGGAIALEPGIARSELPAQLRRCDVMVNAHGAGSADKVVFEALAAGRPVVACSPAFGPLLEGHPLPLMFAQGDGEALTQRLLALAEAPAETRHSVGVALRDRVRSEHSLEHWADAVVARANQVAAVGSVRKRAGRAPAKPRS